MRGIIGLTGGGLITWICVACNRSNSNNVSDAGVLHSDTGVVVLPACVCGAVLFAKTTFSVGELAASNMVGATQTAATVSQSLETQMIAASK